MIYVDELRRYGNRYWCHMVTDGSLEELHDFALRIGLRRRWFQNHPVHPHYDLTSSKRAHALAHGALFKPALDLMREGIVKRAVHTEAA